ncbi:pectate lyase-like adhesive domain-containing protein [Neobacillus sp. PS3-40]|uniref:pectate lyase-like adhesive domain-containing protein n=1 Tax=Neobacillus sp. PS3-40 TaxID=3070679 RepID=UPI0027E09EC2|nr:pectate lyase-like adhesive domain-containing protein [Neobacillus sp. PS3-40]WML46182.1 hypothetical protein RCG20_09935 [Neobacillus sp. PS3-40]
MSKKSKYSKLLVLSSAAAVTGIVVAAANPMQADASSNADQLVKKAEKLAGALKWEVSYEHRNVVNPAKAVDYPNMSLFNETKAALKAAEQAVKETNGKEKEVLEARLSQNVKIYFDRSVKYIDAVTAGKKILEKSSVLDAKLKLNVIDSTTEAAYHDLSREITKRSPILYKAYGKTTRDALTAAYQQKAYDVKKAALYPVSIKIEMDRLNNAIEKQDAEKVAYNIDRLDKFFANGLKEKLLDKNTKIFQTLDTTYKASAEKYEKIVTVIKSDSMDSTKPTLFGGTSQTVQKFDKTIVIVAGNGQHIKLANAEINGDIIIKGDSTGAGTVYLDNVKVNKVNNKGGAIIVDDVADHSLHQTNVTAEELRVNDVNGSNIIAEQGTRIKSLVVTEKAGATGGISLESKDKAAYGTVELASKGAEKSEGVTLKGDFSESKVAVTGEGSSLKVAKDAIVKELDIKTEAKVQADAGAKVQAVNLSAEKKGQNISLAGDFKSTVVNITNANAAIKVAENTEIKEVKKDSSVTENVSVDNKGKIETSTGVVVTNNPPATNNPTTPPSSGGGGQPVVIAVTLGNGSIGIAGNQKITGLITGKRYVVTIGGKIYGIKANGTLGTENSTAEALTGTEITGLTNGMTYSVAEDQATLAIANVKSLEELKAALADETKTTINVTASFSTAEKIVVSRPVTINGGNNTITFTGDITGWQGNYVLQVYNTTGVTVSDLKLQGADGALLVNGSEVTLTGTMDVSGNEYGGIEVGKGSGVQADPSLTVTGASFVNSTEAYGLPTIWEDGVTGKVTGFDGTQIIKGTQPQYYLDATHSVDQATLAIANVKSLEELKAALADETKTTINVTASFSTAEKIVVSRPVTINGGNNTITFTGDITGWQGNYVLQVYNTTGVTVSDLKLQGADGALLVNGSEVTLTGTMDVSGNEYGGIEVGKGSGVQADPSLTVTNANFVNSTEAYGLPTIWEDGVTGKVIGFGGKQITKGTQPQYYLDATHSVDPATLANVKSLEELKAALADETKTTINVTASFSTTEKIVVSRPVTINGGNNTITFTGDITGWQGNYVLQVYNTTGVTVSDLKLQGADGGLLVNGSEVTLTGTMDVSGNEYGGIEVGKGSGVQADPSLTVTNANFVNSTEAYGLPTIWEDGVTGKVIGFGGKQITKGTQPQYYLDATHSVDPATLANVKSLEELKAALADETKTTINVTASFSTTEKIVVSRPVTINGGNNTITFTGDITGWQGNYVLQVYSTTGVTVSDLKLQGADGGLLVNGSAVTLTGTIDVSGNEYGGIEVGKGSGVQADPSLTVTNANFVNSTEAYGLPTIWEDGVTGKVIGFGGKQIIKDTQPQYYLNAENATVATTQS